MKENADLLLRLPGTADERNWLREHLETLSVREWDILAAAVERSPPAAMADAVNNLLTLGEYEVLPAGSYEQLGALYLQTADVPNEQRPAFDKGALGWWYANEHSLTAVSTSPIRSRTRPNLTMGTISPQTWSCWIGACG